MKKLISVVSSAFNEQDNIEELCTRIKQVCESLQDNYDYEQIILDNGSTDNTTQKLKDLAAIDNHIKVIINTRNFGHIRSPYYGMLQAKGDIIISIASDLQEPPELIIDFIKQWEQGYKVVLGQKTSSKENKLMFFIRTLYYKLLNLFNDSGTKLLEHCTGFGLYAREVIDKLKNLKEPYPYLRGLVCELGYEITCVQFCQNGRKNGTSKNSFYTLYDMAMLAFTNYSKVPLRIAAMSGFILSILSFCLALFYLVFKLLFWYHLPAGIAPILISVFFFFSVQLFFIGVLGEYLNAILTHIQNRPLVIEKERINF
ncbi:MAG: glycosyltransferase family 2 protein [Elusimicrobia bacterium]|nr:glycosyltransferase family 2 protein [Elusimicrobiota bacterium]